MVGVQQSRTWSGIYWAYIGHILGIVMLLWRIRWRLVELGLRRGKGLLQLKQKYRFNN